MFPHDVLFLVYSCWYSYHLNKQAETKILRGPHEDLESYLGAIDQLKGNIQFFSSKKSFRSCDAVISNSNNLLTKAILKLEDEFKQRLLSYRFVFSCSLMLLHCAFGSSAWVLPVLLLLYTTNPLVLLLGNLAFPVLPFSGIYFCQIFILDRKEAELFNWLLELPLEADISHL